jgi:hypothetical protein
VFDAKIAELKRRNAKILRVNGNITKCMMLKKPNSKPESKSWNLSLEIKL